MVWRYILLGCNWILPRRRLPPPLSPNSSLLVPLWICMQINLQGATFTSLIFVVVFLVIIHYTEHFWCEKERNCWQEKLMMLENFTHNRETKNESRSTPSCQGEIINTKFHSAAIPQVGPEEGGNSSAEQCKTKQEINQFQQLPLSHSTWFWVAHPLRNFKSKKTIP